MGPAQRRQLLGTFVRSLAEGGLLLFDVVSLVAFAARREAASVDHRLMDGFWAPGDYYALTHTFVYETERVVLDKYTIVEPHRYWTVYNWLQYYSVESITRELESCGLSVVEVLGTVAGDAYDPSSDVFAIVAARR